MSAPEATTSTPQEPQQQKLHVSRSNRKVWWIVIGLAGVLAMSAAAWKLIPKAKEAWRAREAKELTAKAEALVKSGQPEEAFRYYAEAIRKTPRDASVMRAMARCLDEIPGAEVSALRCWNELHHLGEAAWEDTVAMGQAALKSNNLSRAREIESALPKAIYGKRLVREFRTAVLGKAGKVEEARQQMRQIWSEHRDEPECQLKLATLDIKSTDKALKNAAAETLWEAARGEGKFSATAMLTLADSDVVAAPLQLGELALLARKSPLLKDDQRYYIFDHCVAKAPELLPTIIGMAREITALSRTGSRERFYQWVSAQNQPDVILSEIPETEAMNSRGLFLARADSLMRKNMWEDLRRMLDGRFPPVSKVDLELMRAFLARAEAPVDKKREQVRAHLNGAILFASGNSRAPALAQVGAGAESLGQPDIALLAYGELAKINSPARLQTLKRIYFLCEESGDATGMLKAANTLLELEPALLAYANKLDYLRLITGFQLDEALDHTLHATDSAPDDRSMTHLAKSLAAYYSGEREVMKENLETALRLASSLDPGPKAVLAGLLWQEGKREDAISLAQEVPVLKILEEERWFLEPIKQN
ncbi:tetratricopeptide repeat protein [Roseimicrobium gellanilyticum]|uniref:Tetratricopeptide repeat protein n=1 Tax=Roseimicrobium gellanilyticum TaxID=748857 RepID=A0A366HNR2_9BACT|nr:tetratricopeptide repeat protein [Roseimicrobium gellanilyticum]RBP43615.1 tetratricopeptide repeat protein [Roseimicrobium gellanilyticum]